MWMRWVTGTRTELGFGHRCCGKLYAKGEDVVMVAHGWSAKYAMRGGSNNFEASDGPKVLLVPRRPVPMGSGGSAFFAR